MFQKCLLIITLLLSATCVAALEINQASQAELESVRGIGPVTTSKILAARKQGNFKNWDDLIQRVSGIGPGNAAKFSAEGLTVNASTFKKSKAPKAEVSTKKP